MKRKGLISFILVLLFCYINYNINFTPIRYFNLIKGTDVINELTLPRPLWNVTWGGPQYDEGTSVATQSSNIFITGRTDSFGVAGGDIFFAKYDIDGNFLFNTTWGGAGFDIGQGIACGFGGIYVMGYSNSFGALSYDTVLLKYSTSGDLLWNITWGGSKFDLGSSVILTNDAIYLTGYTSSFGAGGYDAFLLKFNSTGYLLWNVTWGGLYAEKAEDLTNVSDEILITGYTNSIDLWNDNVYILKYDNSGNLIWNVTWGGSGEEYGEGIAATSDAIYVTGRTNSFGTGSDYDAFLSKYDLNGNLIWNVTWGGANDDSGKSIKVNNEGIFLTGEGYNNETNSLDVFLLKYDFEGNLNWTRIWGGNATDSGASITMSNEKIFITGITYSFSSGMCDAFILGYNYTSSNNITPDPEPSMPWWSWLIIGALLLVIPLLIIAKKQKNKKLRKSSRKQPNGSQSNLQQQPTNNQ